MACPPTPPPTLEPRAPGDPPAEAVEAAQAELVAALRAGAVAGAQQPLHEVTTHLSRVFIGRTRVYKLKRARKLAFVDQAPLDARAALCAREVELNQAWAPDLYLRAAPVTRARDGGLRLGGGGAALDWLVVMARFRGALAFDALAARGRLTPAAAAAAAAVVAAAHARAAPDPTLGHAADYRAVIADLRRTEADADAALGLAPPGEGLLDRLDRAWTSVQAAIERRRTEGCVRRGHGDLHLRNICLHRGQPTPFDALEFDERLATTDVLYDLAFFLMDLRAFGLDAAANAAFNAYCDAAETAEAGADLLAFFMALRAAVRMAVAVAQADLPQAARYRALGAVLLAPSRPGVLAIGGLSGAGKSSVARALAPLLPGPAGARVLRTDVVRKAADPAPSYTPDARAGVYRALTAAVKAAAEGGGTVIADATFQDPAARAAIAQAAGRGRFLGVWLDAPLALRLERIAGRRGDASDADAAVATAQHDPGSLGPHWRRLPARPAPEALARDIAALWRAG